MKRKKCMYRTDGGYTKTPPTNSSTLSNDRDSMISSQSVGNFSRNISLNFCSTVSLFSPVGWFLTIYKVDKNLVIFNLNSSIIIAFYPSEQKFSFTGWSSIDVLVNLVEPTQQGIWMLETVRTLERITKYGGKVSGPGKTAGKACFHFSFNLKILGFLWWTTMRE